MADSIRLLRITTVPQSLTLLLAGQLNFFQSQGFEVLAVSADGPEVQTLRKQNIPHRVVNLTRKITPLQDVIALVKLIQVIREFKPVIVHTHTPKAGLLGMMAAWLCRVPVRMHTVAGLPLMEATGWKRRILWLTEKITFACATAVFPNSTGLSDFIQQSWNVKSSKLNMIGNGSSNGIDTQYFSRTPALVEAARAIRKKHNIPEDAIVFSFVGRIVKDKGIGELTGAFRQVQATHPDRTFFLLLVGPLEEKLDPLDPEVFEFIHSHPQCIRAGFQHDVRPWMLASDVFVFPSYREGFPNVVMQAACLEIPCIVSDINGCNEIIDRVNTGWIIPPKDKDALGKAMEEVVKDYPAARVKAERARDFVQLHFSRAHVWSSLLKEYQEGIQRHA
ncbi:MAG: glycosyltransferase family 4 protein [Cyclobacteriaceae bacterium]|nr:glycosyltransferase family 4 protein [Cyclobacteriaceae bacterium]